MMVTTTEHETRGEHERFAGLNNIWHADAPERVRQAYQLGGEEEGWACWSKHLARRRQPKPLSKLLKGGRMALAWGLAATIDGVAREELVDRLRKLAHLGKSFDSGDAEQFVAALAGPADDQPRTALAIESLAWCHALPRLAAQLPASLWWDVLRQLVAAANEASQRSHADPWTWQLWSAELPATLAHTFPELSPCRQLSLTGSQTQRDGMSEILDGEGLPQCKDLPLLRPLLACWTRCAALASDNAELAWDDSAREQLAWTVQQVLRFSRLDRSQLFSNQPAELHLDRLVKAATCLSGEAAHKRIAPYDYGRVAHADRSEKKLPPPQLNSPWAGLAIMRPTWKANAPQLAIGHGSRQTLLEWTIGRDTLFAGAWQCQITRDGQPCELLSDWEEICWESDEDIDYLELEAKFSHDIIVQRHIAMTRQDGFLFMADAVVGQQRAALDYRGVLPLGPGIKFSPCEETRDGALAGHKPRARVLPLALGEWRTDHRPGSLEQTDEGLVLRQTQLGQSMFVPLFFDFDRQRRKQEITWRQLTVAEQRNNLPIDSAVGYRVQSANKQWLIYRSLSKPALRTVLGQNLATELLITRFYRTGETAPLVEIEA